MALEASPGAAAFVASSAPAAGLAAGGPAVRRSSTGGDCGRLSRNAKRAAARGSQRYSFLACRILLRAFTFKICADSVKMYRGSSQADFRPHRFTR